MASTQQLAVATIFVVLFTLQTNGFPVRGIFGQSSQGLIEKYARLSTSNLRLSKEGLRKTANGPKESTQNNRRKLLAKLLSFTTVTAVATNPKNAWSDESTPLESAKLLPLSTEEIASRLHKVPTFTIVDKRGVPYMVFGADAKLTAYFFTTYEEADRILSTAIRSADEARASAIKEFREKRRASGVTPIIDREAEVEEFGADNPWKMARISTVPMDFAVALATRRQRGVYFKIAPAEEDVAVALSVDNNGGKDELEEGKVPLFYFEDFVLNRQTNKSQYEMIPLFFRKSDLLDKWNKTFPKTTPPELKVTELFSVLNEMTSKSSHGDDLQKLFFVAPAGSERRANECNKKGKGESPFRLGERIVML